MLPPSRSLYIGNVDSRRVSERDLHDFFSQFGEVYRISFNPDKVCRRGA